MSNAGAISRVLIVLVCAWLVTGVACCPKEAPPAETRDLGPPYQVEDPEGTEEIPLDALMLEGARAFDEKREHSSVAEAEVRRGGALRFFARDTKVWVLIPDRNLRPGHGGDDWCFTDSYIAFKIEKGERASIRVPERYPNTGEDKVIHYSVLAFDGMIWEYIHGSSPPRIRIPR